MAVACDDAYMGGKVDDHACTKLLYAYVGSCEGEESTHSYHTKVIWNEDTSWGLARKSHSTIGLQAVWHPCNQQIDHNLNKLHPETDDQPVCQIDSLTSETVFSDGYQ